MSKNMKTVFEGHGMLRLQVNEFNTDTLRSHTHNQGLYPDRVVFVRKLHDKMDFISFVEKGRVNHLDK
jgi:hypothetical protein